MNVVISGSGLFTPPQTISNEELVASFNAFVEEYNRQHAAAIESGDMQPLQESSVAFIEKASGIKRRHVLDKAGVLDPARMVPRIPERSNEDQGIQCEMSVAAAREAMAQAQIGAEDLDAVIVACSNLQRAYPAVAVEVQSALGVDGFAYDMNVACSSATFGLQAAVNAVQTGAARRVLVVNPEICSAHLNFRDRDSHFIFGDACTAMVVEQAEGARGNQRFEVLGTRLKTLFSNNIRNNFGFLNRCDESGVGKPDKLFVQQGRKVFKEVVPMVSELILAHLQSLNIPASELKRLWLHQANLSMNELIARRVLGRDPLPEEAPVILDEYANTSSAGSVIAYHQYKQDLRTGDMGILCSFGAGYSVGSVVVRKL